ncbi:hypothetical protein J1N35_022992 [Gossypium stocksii]|uniref:Uncharacterized protein n=1 Tax=Gossypium stocksii TaxID=47602 RepID=A0A9D3VHT5_9ROSI|nr:hypothetical protein J1N35_022992 [Gossypium stocksii]
MLQARGRCQLSISKILMKKYWSFLDSEELNSEQAKRNIDRITSAGEISESLRVLVSVGSSLITPIQHQTREKAEGNQAVYKQNQACHIGSPGINLTI